MSVRLISFPFRLTGTGEVAVVEQGSDEQVAQMLAAVLMTVSGERMLAPDFGTQDPAFDSVSRSSLEAQVRLWRIPATVTEVTSRFVSDAVQDVTVSFE